MRFKTSINNKQNSSEQSLHDEKLNDGQFGEYVIHIMYSILLNMCTYSDMSECH